VVSSFYLEGFPQAYIGINTSERFVIYRVGPSVAFILRGRPSGFYHLVYLKVPFRKKMQPKKGFPSNHSRPRQIVSFQSKMRRSVRTRKGTTLKLAIPSLPLNTIVLFKIEITPCPCYIRSQKSVVTYYFIAVTSPSKCPLCTAKKASILCK